MGQAARPKRLAIYGVLRPRQSRSRNGCTACRARRRKCDEEKPVCGFCRDSELPCTWAAPWPKKGGETEQTSAGAAAAAAHPPVPVPLPSTESRASLRPDSPARVGTASSVKETNPPAWQVAGSFLECDEESPSLADLQDLQHQLLQSGFSLDHGCSDWGIEHDTVASKGPRARMLLDHFCNETVPGLLYSDRHGDLLLKYLLPLAKSDSLVLLTVLAVSAIHLRQLQPSVEPEALEYYASALSQVTDILSDRLRIQQTNYQVLLTTLLLLCHYEFVDGNTYGAALQHIKGCHEFIHLALEHLHDSEHQELVVFLVESYGYFSLVANLRGPNVDEDSIGLGLEFSASILPRIKDLPSFGAMFSFEPECLSITPLIARLSRYQEKDEAAESRDQSYRRLYQTLRTSIRSLEPWCVGLVEGESVRDLTIKLVRYVKANALFMFLQATYYRDSKSPTEILELLQPVIDRTVSLLGRMHTLGQPYGLLWCFLVVGSFVHDQTDQRLLLQQLEAIESTMPAKYKGLKLLQWLWDDPDHADVGVAALDRVAVAHGETSFIC